MGSAQFCYVDDIKFPKLAQVSSWAPGRAFGFAAYVVDADGLVAILDQFDAEKVKHGLRPQSPISAVWTTESSPLTAMSRNVANLPGNSLFAWSDEAARLPWTSCFSGLFLSL